MFVNISILKAQTGQGNVLLGVSSSLSLAGTGSDLMTIGFSTTKYKSDLDGFEEPEPDKSRSITLLPRVGYFAVNNVAFGLDMSFSYSNQENGNGGEFSQTLLSVGPFLRFYIPLEGVKPFIEGSAALGSIKGEYTSGGHSEEDKSGLTGLGAGAGIAAPLGKKVNMDFMVGYNSLTIKETEDNEYNFRTVVGTLAFKFGITVLLGNN